jgi:hypothetical protein
MEPSWGWSLRFGFAFIGLIWPSISTPRVDVWARVGIGRPFVIPRRAKRQPALSQRALAFERLGSAFRQVVKQSQLPRLQRALLLAEEIRLRLARALSLQRMAAARNLLSRPAHRERSERGPASGSEGVCFSSEIPPASEERS